MITGISFILIAIYVAMPKSIMITLLVFGALTTFHGLVDFIKDIGKRGGKE